MALKRSEQSSPTADVNKKPAGSVELETLLKSLISDDIAQRRLAARELSNSPDSCKVLLERLPEEPDHSVREAIFCSLEQIGGDTVADGLISLLRTEDAALRNAAIEVLQTQPETTAPRIEALLADEDSDVRIFAIDILQTLVHPDAPRWLEQVLRHETHINVLGTAIDRATEIGDERIVPVLQELQTKVADNPYLKFAVDLAIQRIGDIHR